MPVPAGGDDLRIHPTAIVADENPQVARGVFNFDYNFGGAGMPERIGKSFPADKINLIVSDGPQRTGRALDNDAKFAVCGNREVFLNAGKLFLKILANGLRRAQSADSVAAFI